MQELAVKLREIVLLKRQLDDVPVQAELIQYASFLRNFASLRMSIVIGTDFFIDPD